MVEVKFYDSIEDRFLKFAVIIARSNGKWVFCKHRERDTYEIPGGHREANETILETAKRELQEETSAKDYEIKPLFIYSVTTPNNFNGKETFGEVYLADIYSFEDELHSEIEKIILADNLIDNWTYPLIQPKLIEEAGNRGYL